ncbi:MAG TPA: MarR family transcriptional regulator [Acidobacteriaceae bacterium]|jgi:DNA-binding MarR family transcriptional regulator|nr:MarR family transcriptional regulator [Acidobacteriaceae bacterium]
MSTSRQLDAEATAQAFHSAAIHLLRKLRRVDSSSGLNAPRLSALSVIAFAGPLTLGRLADAEQVRPPTMTRIVNALETKGLVTKSSSASDRRTIHISATTRGKRLLLLARNRRVESLARQIHALPSHDKKILHDAIAVLNKLTRTPLVRTS